MTSPYHLPVISATQVGTFFVGNYYQVLQTQPDFVHQFYNDTSTLLRVDGVTRQTASSMLQIHALVMSLNYTGIEIKTVHSLDSWDRGVLVLVSGSVHLKDFASRRNFVQTFFLAPQETGYFVLNDIFQFVDDQPIHHHPVAFMTQNDLVSKLNGTTAVREQASSYMPADDIQARDYVPPTTAEENGTVNNYSFQEQQLQDPVSENIHEDNYSMQTNGSVQNPVSALKNHSTPVEEVVVGEPQKHTYASILQVAKGHPAPSAPREQPVKKSAVPSDSNNVSKPPSQQSRSGAEAANDTSVVEDEVEVLSVYVKNVPSTALASEIEEEFKKFGKIRPDGVAIRTRKDINVCYAFVEYALVLTTLSRHLLLRLLDNRCSSKEDEQTEATLIEVEEEEEEATKRMEKGVLEVETIATEAMIVITHDQEATATIVKPGHIPTPTRLLKMVMYHQIEDHEGLKVR